MSKISLLQSIRLKWFIHKHRQPLRNTLSAEGVFCHLSFRTIKEGTWFPEIVAAHHNDKLVHEFIRKFPTLYVCRAVFEWDEAMTVDTYGTPGIYIKDVFDVLPEGVYMGYQDRELGQLLFIPMYVNVNADEEGRIINGHSVE